MEDAQTILSWSFLVVLLSQFLLTLNVTGAAFATIFSDQTFNYKFDKSRITKLFNVILILFLLFCLYGYLISKKKRTCPGIRRWNVAYTLEHKPSRLLSNSYELAELNR